jgi:hypothetical protein
VYSNGAVAARLEHARGKLGGVDRGAAVVAFAEHGLE